MDTDLVKMSEKGQLVVPQDIREKEGFVPGDRFAPFAVKDGILFKRINIPDVKAEFHKLSQQLQQHLQKQGVHEQDVSEAIKWARKK